MPCECKKTVVEVTEQPIKIRVHSSTSEVIKVGIRGLQGVKGDKGEKGDKGTAELESIPISFINNLFGA